MNRATLQTIYYSYFQIGYIVPIVVPNSNTNAQAAGDAASPEKSSYIGIIIGLIVGVSAVSIAIVVFVKWYFKSIAYVTPEKNDFRAMPALSF